MSRRDETLGEVLEVGASIAGVTVTALAVVAILLDGYGVAVSLLGIAFMCLLLAAVLRIARLGRER